MKTSHSYLATLIIVIVGIILCSVIISNKPDVKAEPEAEKGSSSFVIESGPEKIGYSTVRIIRHIETNKRFIFTERSSGGTTLTPLN